MFILILKKWFQNVRSTGPPIWDDIVSLFTLVFLNFSFNFPMDVHYICNIFGPDKYRNIFLLEILVFLAWKLLFWLAIISDPSATKFSFSSLSAFIQSSFSFFLLRTIISGHSKHHSIFVPITKTFNCRIEGYFIDMQICMSIFKDKKK